MELQNDADSDKEASEKFLQAVVDICDELETPTLEEYGINKEEFFDVIDKMASDAMESGSPSNTRKAITAEDVKEIYKIYGRCYKIAKLLRNI